MALLANVIFCLVRIDELALGDLHAGELIPVLTAGEWIPLLTAGEHKVAVIDSSDFSATIKQHCGAFVTLKKRGDLRGCIGRFITESPLYLIVRDMAVAAGTQDPRFTAVTADELKNIDIEISVLSPLQKINSIDEIEMGTHGIYIVKGSSTGTFLPQVATETGWTKEQFLGHCAQDKAGIGWNGWKDADIYIYTAVVFGEKE
jgi:hypothetical protein